MKVPLVTRTLRFAAQLSPWAASTICFFFVPSTVWAEASASLITALALISGAILLRIMRAFPITDPDGFADKAEIDSLEFALREAMTSLAFAVGIAVAAILLLVFQPLLVNVATGVPEVDAFRGEAFSALMGWITVFVAARITYVVRMDFSIVGKQAKAVRHAFEKRQSREIEESRRAQDDLKYKFKDEAPYPGRRKDTEH